MMIAFLNEHSLEEYGDWSNALSFFLGAARELSTVSAVLFKDSAYFSEGCFKRKFHAISFPKDQRALILELVFGSRYYKCWRPARLSNCTDEYTCTNPRLDLHDVTICEAAEHKLADASASVSLLSASGSAFSNIDPITVLKTSSQRVTELKNATSINAITRWIVAQKGYYDPASTSAPRDAQTILGRDSVRFRATGKFDRKFSRSVFEEVASGRLYHVDEGHPGYSAHLEVYSASREHLGTADIRAGELNTAERVNGRVLRY
jgi:hypothetical protein